MSLADVEDLLSRPARAAIAYVGPDGPECAPVVVRRDEAIRIGMDPGAVPTTGAPERVVLVVDDGGYWFDLRAAVWRGVVAPEDDGRGRSSEDGLVWSRVTVLLAGEAAGRSELVLRLRGTGEVNQGDAAARRVGPLRREVRPR